MYSSKILGGDATILLREATPSTVEQPGCGHKPDSRSMHMLLPKGPSMDALLKRYAAASYHTCLFARSRKGTFSSSGMARI